MNRIDLTSDNEFVIQYIKSNVNAVKQQIP
jgi:hypothetical protein